MGLAVWPLGSMLLELDAVTDTVSIEGVVTYHNERLHVPGTAPRFPVLSVSHHSSQVRTYCRDCRYLPPSPKDGSVI